MAIFSFYESFQYSRVPTLYNLFRYELDIALVKPASNQVTTVGFYDERIAGIEKLSKHIHDVFGVDYLERSKETLETLNKKQKILEKQLKEKTKKK